MNGHSPTLGYIHDGYTMHGYITAVPRLHPALRFTFRPVLSQNRAVIFRQIATADDPRREESLAAQAVKAQVIAWNLVNHHGGSVPLEVSHILRMQPQLFNRLFRIVMGDEAGDEDPSIADEVRNRDVEADLAAALAGETPEEADSKNSPTG
ncbi:MAG: hypothetical protein RIC55_21375 [Pirellulaceae bacterium]